MRKALVTACLLAALVAPAAAAELVPRVAPGTPALQTWSGRAWLCRAYLETQGYPYAYLHRRASLGVVRTCAARLNGEHRLMLRRS
jgi:hypothetical protein